MTEVTYSGEPKYLDHVENLIGMKFFSDPALEDAAHTDLSQFRSEEISTRAGLYVTGLRLVLAAEKDFTLRRGPHLGLGARDLAEFREQHRDTVGEVRGELMTLDTGLETNAVTALRLALHHVRENQPSRQDGESKQPLLAAQALPPELLPVSTAAQIVTMQRANIQNRIWPQDGDVPPRKIRLKGSLPESCCTWTELRQLVEGTDISGNKRMLRPGVEIDWERLPKDNEDATQAQIEYAREIQAKFIPSQKLYGFETGVFSLPIARPHHISLYALKKLLGGGYAFIEEYRNAHAVPMLQRRSIRNARSGEYLRIEDAAEIWEAYEMIPVANQDDAIAADILKQAGTRRTGAVYECLTPAELPFFEKKRALKPKGRILSHAPSWLARRLVGRLRPITLPAHLLPMQSIEGIASMTESFIGKRRSKLGLRATTLSLIGSPRNLPQVCFDWPTVKGLVEHITRGKEPLIEIDFDMLPPGPNDTNETRIAYARFIQRQLVPAAIHASFYEAAEPQVIPDSVASLPIIPRPSRETEILLPTEPNPSQEMWRTKPASTGLGGSYFSGGGQFLGAGSKDGLPPEKPKVHVRHLDEEPGSWAPAVVTGPRMVSQTERLTADGIATALAISRELVDSAITRIDFDTTSLGEDRVYTGNELLAIREQLVGVPLEYLQRIHRFSDDELSRVKEFLLRNKFDSFDGYISPGAVEYLTANIHIARERREEPKKKEKTDITMSADGEVL